MSRLGTWMSFFPAFLVLVTGGALWNFVQEPSLTRAALVPAAIYILPLLCFRLHQKLWPLPEGFSKLVGTDYSPWYGGHQIQLIFIAFPILETFLRLIPGLFSLWLRGWGSKIGRAVYWTPSVEILDRSLLTIGDRVVFGHRCGISAHIINPRKGNLTLWVARVSIGEGAFVGAGSYIAPGAQLEAGAVVPAGQHVYPKGRVESPGPVQARSEGHSSHQE